MQLVIERNPLLRALSHIQSVVERRNTIPILSNVELVAEGETLRLTATDLDIALVEEVPARVAAAGGTTVPAHTLHDIIRKFPDGAELSLALDGDRLVLRAGGARFQLATLPREDFPQLAADELPHCFSLGADVLKRLIDKTRFAISTEETRYYLNGIYFHVAEAGSPLLKAVATDGHRLARVETAMPEGAAGMPGVIVPRKTVAELRKLVDEYDGAIAVSLSDTRIRFAFDSAVLTSKLIDGTFPDYERVIPTANDKILRVDARLLAEAVDRVSTISSEKTRSVKLTLEADRIVLSVTSPEHGTATEELTAAYGGEPLEIGFNARYLLDILAQIEGAEAEVRLMDATSPTIIVDPEDESALYVLMPMRV
ncbi:MAG: DNA polymerase III subunit beta [Alphaproteobacteria bacterium]|nr:MAG: DNA polymerase III subunit beta [Alphaproteobacteria bacterium]